MSRHLFTWGITTLRLIQQTAREPSIYVRWNKSIKIIDRTISQDVFGYNLPKT